MKEKILELGTEGGAITVFEIKDDNNETKHFLIKTKEIFDEDFSDIKINNEFVVNAKSLDEFWPLLKQKYPYLYNFYPVFINKDHIETIGMQMVNDYFSIYNDDELYAIKEWFKATHLDYDYVSQIKSANKIDYMDMVEYIALNKTFDLDLKEFFIVEAAFRKVWNQHTEEIMGDGNLKNEIFKILEKQIIHKEITIIPQNKVEALIDLIIDYMSSINQFNDPDIWDDTPDLTKYKKN